MIRKILFIALRNSYGKKALGEALNRKAHSDMLRAIGYQVEDLWLDDYDTNAQLQNAIIEKAYKFRPEIIFFKIFKFEIQFSTLEKLKKDFFLVNWFGDDQWRFDKFTSKYANFFDACITTDKFSLDKYKSIGQKNVILSQHASFENFANYNDITYKYGVSFVGGANPFRKWFIKELKKRGIMVNCFGNGWENGRITYDQMDQIMLYSKVNLNISNSLSYDVRFLLDHPKNILALIKSSVLRGSKSISQTKARIFEIPVRGGFEITEYVPNLDDYFDIGKNIVCYNNVDEAALIIKYYLNNSEERERIKKRSVELARMKHTYRQRSLDFMNEIERLYQVRENER